MAQKYEESFQHPGSTNGFASSFYGTTEPLFNHKPAAATQGFQISGNQSKFQELIEEEALELYQSSSSEENLDSCVAQAQASESSASKKKKKKKKKNKKKSQNSCDTESAHKKVLFKFIN